jgi:hypothetical protein
MATPGRSATVDCNPTPKRSLVDPRSVATGRFAVSESAVGADYVEIRADARTNQEEGPWRLSLLTRTTDVRRTIEARRGLPKCKVKDGDTRPKKLNLKLPISDCSGLSDQLVHPWLGNGASALLVNVEAMSVVWGAAIDQYVESHRTAIGRGTQDQIDIAGVKAVHEPPVGRVRNR